MMKDEKIIQERNLLEIQIIWQLDVFAPFEKQRNMFGIRIPLFFKKIAESLSQ